MALTLAFDVYGTLINTHGVVSTLESMVGEHALLFSQTWRNKQLEYTFRRGLMRQYQDFSVCTAQALDYSCEHLKQPLSALQKQTLLKQYNTLPAFTDARTGLSSLSAAGHELFAFSNGTETGVNTVLQSAKIREPFKGIVSVDELQTFKPDPAVYRHLLSKTASDANKTWLVSSNPFDVIGAINIGLQAAWVQRDKDTVFDPWGITPTLTVADLDQLFKRLPG